MPSLIITFQNIRPLPKEGPRQEKRRNTRKHSSAIYTDSPEKDALMKQKLDNKKKVELTRKKRKSNKKARQQEKEKVRKIQIKEKHPLVEKVTRKILNKLNSSSSNETDDAMCLVCIVSNIKSIPGEEWIQCMKCSM